MEFNIYKTKDKTHIIEFRNNKEFCCFMLGKEGIVQTKLDNREMALFLYLMVNYCFSKKKTILKEYNKLFIKKKGGEGRYCERRNGI